MIEWNPSWPGLPRLRFLVRWVRDGECKRLLGLQISEGEVIAGRRAFQREAM